MTVLNSMLTSIVFLPLVIISLLVIYAIAYGIWSYRTTGEIPPMYLTIGKTIYFIIIKLLIPVKLLGQFLWWLLPIFPDRFRVPLGYVRLGAWDPLNIGRTLLLLSLSAFITISYLVYNYGYPNALVAYSQYLNITLYGLGIMFLVMLFIAFNKSVLDGNGPAGAFPATGNLDEKSGWLFNSGASVLFWSIAVGVVIAILGCLCYLASKYSFFSLTGLNVLMILAGLGVMFTLYYFLSSSPYVSGLLRNNSVLSFLFYAVFIIPCLFLDTIKYLYNQFRHTPKTVYIILAAEIVLVTLYVIVPIIQKYFYLFVPPASNKLERIKLNIKSNEATRKEIQDRIAQIKSYNPPDSKKLDDQGWETVITKNYNSPDNEEELKSFLMNYGYKTKQMCTDNPMIQNKSDCSSKIEKMINYIQTNTTELVGLKSKLQEVEESIKKLKKEKSNVNDMEKGKLLLDTPIYLKNKKHIGGYTDFKMAGDNVEYNYNYGISAWFFIRAQPPNYGKNYREFTSILNYGNKPNILYNGKANTLRIIMDNGKNKKPIVYEVKEFPLQKWNNVVVNYDGGTLDIYINAKLVASFPNTLPYMSMDEITVGDDNGIGGGVCNVVYFPTSISKERIDINYRILSNKNPPVI